MQARFCGLPFVVYPVRDMAVSLPFYRDVLGLTPGEAWEDKWVEFETGGGCALALSTLMQGCVPGAQGAAAALETECFQEMVGQLRARGVRFILEPMDSGVCWFARFADPDGNHLILHEKHRAAAGA